MNIFNHQRNTNWNYFLNQKYFQKAQFVFQNESAPASPESFKGPEKLTDTDILNEVAPMTPSEIVSDTISKGGAVKARYQQSTAVLAGLLGANGANGAAGSNAANTANSPNSDQTENQLN